MLSIAYLGIILNAALIHGCIHEGPRANQESRIIGGDDIERKDIPYLVWIGMNTEFEGDKIWHTCGGTLTSVYGIQVVITSVSCIGKTGNTDAFIYGGAQRGGQHRKSKQILIHEGYRGDAAGNDIALLLFDEDFRLEDDIGFAKLPPKDFVLNVGENLLVTGAGYLSSNDTNESWQQKGIILPVISSDECERLYEDLISQHQFEIRKDHFFCMHSEGKNVCIGDEGGPAVTTRDGPPILAGVIVGNLGCAQPNRPGVFTRVAEFTDWIEEKIAQVQQSYYPWDGYEY